MIYFTADPHFGHQNIIKYCNRPWKYWDEMDEALIENFNSVVTDKDVVYLLGDIAFHKPVQDYMGRLRGKEHHLIMGNHDKMVHCMNMFHSISQVKALNIKGIPNIWLSHYAHRTWPASHYGSIHLFGHSHGMLHIEPGAKCIDVGVDAWNYKPVSLDEIIEYIKAH